MKVASKGIEKIADILGSQYTLILIDEEWCLYRDLGNGYDIEINLGGTRGEVINVSVRVWQVRGKLKVTEVINNIREVDTLERILKGVIYRTKLTA